MAQAQNQSQVLETYTLLQIAAEQMFGRKSDDLASISIFRFGYEAAAS